MPFVELEQVEARQMAPGITAKFVHCGSMTLAHWFFEPGTPLKEHSHPHEQMTNLLEGEFELTVAGVAQRLTPDVVGVIPPHVVHSGKAITRCHVIDVFCPVREDYR